MAASEQVPRIIGRRYQVIREIGAGNMGAVFEAVDRLNGQYVAVKQMRFSADQLEYGSHTNDDDLNVALAQEFRILASLRHPNIISVLDYGFDLVDGIHTPYITMELLQNANSFLEYGIGLSHDEKVDLLVKMLQALMYLHRRGILHRDLKPKNVLVDAKVVKVLDFGLSIPGEQAKEGEVAGTPSYMAPELWVGGRPSRESDLFAVGVMAFRLFAGAAPFETTNLKQLFVEVRNKIPDFSLMKTTDSIRQITAKLLAKDPADRYSDAHEVALQLLSAIGHSMPLESTATRESFLQAATFVGREHELGFLSSKLQHAVEGQGNGLLIAGESGVGKSRLVEELRTLALVQGALVLRGQAIDNITAPYTLWRGAARWLALLGNLNEQQASILKPLVPDIERLLGYPVADAPEVSPQETQSRLFQLMEQLFYTQTQRQSVVVILEDLQWADGESISLLAYLSRAVPKMPIMIVASYRDDEMPEVPQLLPEMGVLHLHRLNSKQTAELTQAILGPRGANPNLLDLLQRETEGNTFFLVEMVRALAEEAGQLSAVGDAPLPISVLTGGVQGIVQRRLNRVPETARPLLQWAAVGGRQLDMAVLRHIFATKAPQIDRWLNECADAAVLEVEDGQWRFAHNKLRDGALDELDSDTFMRLSHETAIAVEIVYEVSTRQNAELLAYYWGSAGNLEKEEQYSALAGEQALKNGAYRAAAAYLKRTLDLHAQIETSRRKTAQVLQQLGDAYRGMNDAEMAQGYYRQSLDICREIDYRWGLAACLNKLGEISVERGLNAAAAQQLNEALRIATEARAQPVALRSLVAIAGLNVRIGQPALAVQYATVALNHLSSDGQTHYLAERLINSLQDSLSPEVMKAAVERGHTLEFKELVNQIVSA